MTTRSEPRLDTDNRPFWTGGAQNELLITRCQDCGTFIHPPKPVCRKCLSENVKAEAVAGTGVVDTFTVNYQAWLPGLEVPFIIARVALDDAPEVYLTTNIMDCPVDEIDFGDKVQVSFEQQGEIYYPLFKKTV